jgi:hypothetical protein
MNTRTLLYVLLVALVFALPQILVAGRDPFYYPVQGLLLAVCFLPAVRRGPSRPRSLFWRAWLLLEGVGVAGILVEAKIFSRLTPLELVGAFVFLTLVYTLFAAALAWLAQPLGAMPREATPAPARFPAAAYLWRLPAAGAAYLALYWVFGWIFFATLTEPYYRDSSLRLQLETLEALGHWFPVIQFARGLGMALVALPLLLALRMGRLAAGVTMGAILWVVGGLVPLTVPNELFPGLLRLYHIFEILFQNGLLGVAMAWLLLPRRAPDGTAGRG